MTPFRLFLRHVFRISVWGWLLLPRTGLSADSFELLSQGVPSAEIRSIHCGKDQNGKRFILLRLQDCGPRGYVLVCEVDAGRTKQYFVPETVKQDDSFGSLLTAGGRYYFDYPKAQLLEFDMRHGHFRRCGKPAATAVHFMSYAEAPDGSLWMGYYPGAGLIHYNPDDDSRQDFGSLESGAHYVFELVAAPDGWIYAGTGTRKAGVTALHPATGQKRQLLPPQARMAGFGSVQLLQDGSVQIRGRGFLARAKAGELLPDTTANVPPAAPENALRYFSAQTDFGDGSKLVECDLANRRLTIAEVDGSLRTLPLQFQSGGIFFTALGLGPDGKIYGSTSHPMHLTTYDPVSGKFTDLGPNPVVGGGNFCNFTADSKYLYGCEYPGGRLWRFDPALPPRFRSGGDQWFGPAPQELAYAGSARRGFWLAESTPRSLRAYFRSFQPDFLLTLPVPAPGSYYLNLRFYEHSFCRNLTVEFAGQKKVVSITPDSAPIITIGPVPLTTASATVHFRPGFMADNNNSFAISGLELAPAPRLSAANDHRDNPVPIGRWADLVTRPRAVAVHPTGDRIMAGHSNYGLTGGGFGIITPNGEMRELKSSWLPGHSCIAMTILPDGSLIGSTSNEAPGGGATEAAAAAVFRMTWPDGKVIKQRSVTGENYLMSTVFFQKKIFVASGPGRIYIFDPDSLDLQRKIDQRQFGSVPRNGLLITSDHSRLLLLQKNGIFELDARGEARLLGKPPFPITGAGVYLDGFVYYTSEGKLWRFRVPAKPRLVPDGS